MQPLIVSFTHPQQELNAGPIKVPDALAWHVDLLSPISKPVLQALFAYANSEERKCLEQLVHGSAKDHKAWHQQSRCLLEALEKFLNVKPPIGMLVLSFYPNFKTLGCCGNAQ